MKECTVCKIKKETTEFYSDKSRSDSLSNRCKQCDKAGVKARTERNKEVRLQYNREYQYKHRDRINKLRRERPKTIEQIEARREYSRQHFEANKDTRKEQQKAWREANKDKNAFYSAKRRANKLKATTKWADLEYIEDLYKNAQEANAVFKDYGILFHIDHIVPLQNKKVCGLHTEDNLQILSAQDNQRKSNTYEVI